MSEETVEREPVTLEQALAKLEEMHEIVASMKQCNPNIHEIRAMIFDRWRTVLWEAIPVVKEFLLSNGDAFNVKPGKVEVLKKRMVVKLPKKR